eukprot:3722274-Pyramimonas_sp.AAC.1
MPGHGLMQGRPNLVSHGILPRGSSAATERSPRAAEGGDIGPGAASWDRAGALPHFAGQTRCQRHNINVYCGCLGTGGVSFARDIERDLPLPQSREV